MAQSNGRQYFRQIVDEWSPQLEHRGITNPEQRIHTASTYAHIGSRDPHENLRAFRDHYSDMAQDSRSYPTLAGVGYNRSSYVAEYGTSGPKDPIAREYVIDNRLRSLNPALYANMEHTRVHEVGNCCEFVTIPAVFGPNDGKMRTVVAESLEISSGKTRKFCEICRQFVKKAVGMYPGLRVIDAANNNKVYQSTATAQRYEAQQVAIRAAQYSQTNLFRSNPKVTKLPGLAPPS
ncbi:hypothetical protein DFH06DRAFT_1128307 [Mycena polygramma]|nr:hypothetical protein DFH06DRAFT_1128307 [Mycena polygramma]